MFFVIFGTRSSKIKKKKLNGNTACSKCNSIESFNVQGSASYFHLFWIPIIPLRKTIEFICRNCGQHHFKETAPRSVISNYKNGPLKRPWWHFIFLVLLTYQVLNFVGFMVYYEIDSYISNSKIKEEKEFVESKRQDKITLLKEDLDKVTRSPDFEKDSVSFLLQKELNFSSYGLDHNTRYYSVVKRNMILVLMDIKNIDSLDEADHMLFIKNVRDVIYKSYPHKAFEVFIGIGNANKLIASGGNSVSFQYVDIQYINEYNYPLINFYDRDSLPSYSVGTKLEHIRLVYDYEGVSSKKIELDTLKLVAVWKKINDKYKFKYGGTIDKLPNKVFMTSSQSLLPEDLTQFFKYQNLTGPFIKIDKLKLRLNELSKEFYNTSINALKLGNYNDKTERIVPISITPRWFPFYEDYTYTYAMDMLPNKNGYVGQIIQLGKNGNPNKFIATDLVSFLELYLKGEIHVDIQDWN